MKAGAYRATTKDGKVVYRSKISYHGKSVSLGTYDTEDEANGAYTEAQKLYTNLNLTIDEVFLGDKVRAGHKGRFLPSDKVVSILNHRDHDIYIKTPIYIRNGYISYFMRDGSELKFDMDELFYYSSHRILKRGESLYVNDFGMQYRILDRYGIHINSVSGKDYTFVNGDSLDFRSANVIVVNPYFGVHKKEEVEGKPYFEAKIHLNGDYIIGRYKTQVKAAIAYNKACDYAKENGLDREFIQNYIDEISPREYADIYTEIKLPQSFLSFFE